MKDYYRITRTIGHKSNNGKKVPIKKEFRGATKDEAEAKYQDFLKSKSNDSKTVSVTLNINTVAYENIKALSHLLLVSPERYMKAVIELTSDNDSNIIFDEISSDFRCYLYNKE